MANDVRKVIAPALLTPTLQPPASVSYGEEISNQSLGAPRMITPLRNRRGVSGSGATLVTSTAFLTPVTNVRLTKSSPAGCYGISTITRIGELITVPIPLATSTV